MTCVEEIKTLTGKPSLWKIFQQSVTVHTRFSFHEWRVVRTAALGLEIPLNFQQSLIFLLAPPHQDETKSDRRCRLNHAIWSMLASGALSSGCGQQQQDSPRQLFLGHCGHVARLSKLRISFCSERDFTFRAQRIS